MTKLAIGLVAHVDAGKTTLAEALLYQGGTQRELGRVDKGSAFLDPDQLEKQRGLTIESHQAELTHGDLTLTLVDTPGHADFAAATERVLQVLDYAVLVIAAPAGVQATTRTLWHLLQSAGVPTFIFVNKVDVPGVDRARVLKQLQEELAPACLPFDGDLPLEDLATLDESLLDQYLESGTLTDSAVRELIAHRRVFPVYYGSALKLTGVGTLLTGLERWGQESQWPAEFGARVFKVSHDSRGNRLTWLRVLGGHLKAKDALGQTGEKADQLRVYNGDHYEIVREVPAGAVVTVAGPQRTVPGQGLGAVTARPATVHPVLTYTLDPRDEDFARCLAALRQLADEEPLLGVTTVPDQEAARIQVVGPLEVEILTQRLASEFGLTVAFTPGGVLYQETIARPIEGVGHFEPLRHYAEVHLLLEPGEPGSGLTFASACPVDVLSRAWQGQVLTALRQLPARGVLINAPLTDVKVTLVGGRGSLVHTVGGDFAQAARRALRQGLMELGQSGNRILEPWYAFRLLVDAASIGRALTDLQRFGGQVGQPVEQPGGLTLLTGRAPVTKLQTYGAIVRGYTHGRGQLELTVDGAAPVAEPTSLIEATAYQPLHDLANPPGSVFCAHGAGYPVAWDRVPQTMHVPYLTKDHSPARPVTSGPERN